MSTDTILNSEAVAQMKELMEDAFPAVVAQFQQSGGQYVEEIANGIASNDTHRIAEAAHPLKSSAKQMGADQLAGLARTMEHEARAASDVSESMQHNFHAIKAAFEAASTALNAEIS